MEGHKIAGGEKILEQAACILWQVRDRSKTVLHQLRGKAIAQGQCIIMTLEGKHKFGNWQRKITQHQKELMHQWDSKPHTTQAMRQERCQEKENLQRRGDSLRTMRGTWTEQDYSLKWRAVSSIWLRSISWREMKQLRTANTGTFPRHLHHSQVMPDATGCTVQHYLSFLDLMTSALEHRHAVYARQRYQNWVKSIYS